MLYIPYSNGKQEISLQYGKNPARILTLSLSWLFPVRAQYTQTQMLTKKKKSNPTFNINSPYLWGSVIAASLGLIDFPVLFILDDVWKYVILVLLVLCLGVCFIEFINYLRSKQQSVEEKGSKWFYVRLKPASFGNVCFLVGVFFLQLEILKFCIILLNHPTVIELVVLVFLVLFNQLLTIVSCNLFEFKIENEIFVPYNKSKYRFSKLK